MLSEPLRIQITRYQRNEMTERVIYLRLARQEKSEANRRVLERIAEDEGRHYVHWRQYTQQDVGPAWGKVFYFQWIRRLLGLTFAVKLLERGEALAQASYAALPQEANAGDLIRDEGEHEAALLAMLDEERLRYIGSIVLGLNDALVELTGALAGLTLALRQTRLIAMTGAITGIAAALSMASSEYLSTKTEGGSGHPVKAAFYTGVAYLFTVLLLICPYLVLSHYSTALLCTLGLAVLVIAFFTYYNAVARDQPFGKRFAEMLGLSLGVAGVSFGVGFLLRSVLGVDG